MHRAASRSRRQLPPRQKPKRSRKPFTPDGTGTVVDNATDEDGKEFYTITTADESVFYLVIDKQKTSENVYFLNTVTTDDLLPLAEQGKEPPKEVTPEPPSLSAPDRCGGACRRWNWLLFQDLQAEA